MQRETFKNIDMILGDHTKRYFSNGFKKTKYDLYNICIEPLKSIITANSSVLYSKDWSIKSSSVLNPHLSTLDAFLLSLHINNTFINNVFSLNEEQKTKTWVRKVIVKAGTKPQCFLDQIEVKSTLSHIQRNNKDSLCGNTSRFITIVGSLKVEMVLDHFINTTDTTTSHIKGLGKSDSAADKSCYHLPNESSRYSIKNIHVDHINEKITSTLKIENSGVKKFWGISSYYMPFYSMIDIFTCASQQMQALLYRLDGINRSCSNNLWMRKVEIEYKAPLRLSRSVKQQICINNTKTLSINDQKWRIADLSYGLCIPDSPLYLSTNLAHQLPEYIEHKGA